MTDYNGGSILEVNVRDNMEGQCGGVNMNFHST